MNDPSTEPVAVGAGCTSKIESTRALNVPVALPSINPEYDPGLDGAIPTARVVVREEKNTVILPDFSKKIIIHRHMDDGTVDIFTQHHHTDGNTTYFERLNVPESEVALELGSHCSQKYAQVKGGSNTFTQPMNETQLDAVTDSANALTQHAEEDLERKRRIKQVVLMTTLAIAFIAIAVLSGAEYFLVPAIALFAIAIGHLIQLLSPRKNHISNNGRSSSSSSSDTGDDSV